MIRVTLACLECRQVLDGTFAAAKLGSMVTAFEEAHLFPSCNEENPRGREAQDEPAAGATDAGGSGPDETRRGRDRIGTDPTH